jgi:hypothetical protein
MESAFGPSTTSHTQLRVLLVEDLPTPFVLRYCGWFTKK